MGVLEDALQATRHEREETYGHPEDDFTRAAAIASAATGLDIRATDIPVLMISVKLARVHHTPSHWDSWVDIAGYSDAMGRILERMGDRGQYPVGRDHVDPPPGNLA